MTAYIIIACIALVVAIIAFSLKNEEKIVERAEKTNSMFNFYHILAVLTSPNYKGYISSKEEQKAMDDYLNAKAIHESHPIGSYFKMCKENRQMLKSMPSPSFNGSDLAIGLAVMGAFVLLIVLAV